MMRKYSVEKKGIVIAIIFLFGASGLIGTAEYIESSGNRNYSTHLDFDTFDLSF